MRSRPEEGLPGKGPRDERRMSRELQGRREGTRPGPSSTEVAADTREHGIIKGCEHKIELGAREAAQSGALKPFMCAGVHWLRWHAVARSCARRHGQEMNTLGCVAKHAGRQIHDVEIHTQAMCKKTSRVACSAGARPHRGEDVRDHPRGHAAVDRGEDRRHVEQLGHVEDPPIVDSRSMKGR